MLFLKDLFYVKSLGNGIYHLQVEQSEITGICQHVDNGTYVWSLSDGGWHDATVGSGANASYNAFLASAKRAITAYERYILIPLERRTELQQAVLDATGEDRLRAQRDLTAFEIEHQNVFRQEGG